MNNQHIGDLCSNQELWKCIERARHTHTPMNKVLHWKLYGQYVVISRGRKTGTTPKQGINQREGSV